MAKDIQPTHITKKHIARAEREKKQTRILIYGAVAVFAIIVIILGYGYLDSRYFRQNRAVAKVGDISITANQFRSQTILERIQNINQYNYDQDLIQYAQMFGDYTTYVQAYYDSMNIQNKMADATSFAESKLESMIQDAVIKQQAGALEPPILITEEDIDKALEESFGFYPAGTPTAAPTSTFWASPTISNTQLAILGPTRTPTLGPTLEIPTSTMTPVVNETPQNGLTTEAESSTTPSPTEEIQPTATLAVTETPTSTPTEYTRDLFQKNVETYVAQYADYGLKISDIRTYVEARMLKQKVFEVVTKDVLSVQEQVWARHILVSTEEAAKSILARLAKGEDWTTIAAEASIDTATKDDGGDLGWFPRGVMVSEFEESAFTQEIGSISDPVQSSMGFHIIQVVGHETRPVSSNYLASLKQKAFDKWINQFITDENVQRFDLWKEFVPTQPELVVPTQN